MTAIDPVEPAALISMFGDQVVICPPLHLDVGATEALVDAAAGAVESGATVMIDLDPMTPAEELVVLGLPTGASTDARSDAGTVTVLGPAMVRLRTGGMFWTIDLAHGRLVRTDRPVDPTFVVTDRWTAVRAVWATCRTVSALTADGDYITTLSAWSSSPRDRRSRERRLADA